MVAGGFARKSGATGSYFSPRHTPKIATPQLRGDNMISTKIFFFFAGFGNAWKGPKGPWGPKGVPFSPYLGGPWGPRGPPYGGPPYSPV